MKYLILTLILFSASCSLNKDTAYLDNGSINKTSDFMSMTFDEFNLFLENYSNNAEYPDIN